MEYSKLYIDPDVSLNSLLEKIETEPADKLVIVIHQKSSIFTGQVNIELIKKYAYRADKELVFITQIKKIKNLLADSGFKVYSNLEQFENQSETEGMGEVKKQNFSSSVSSNNSSGIIKKVLPVLFLVLTLAGVCFYFWFPLVTIQVNPIVKNKTVINQIKGKAGIRKIKRKQKVLPLIKEQIEIKKTVKAAATGQKKIGVKRSRGQITFINNQQQEVTIPEGTEVRSVSGVEFRTLHKVTVPPAEVDKLMDKVVSSKTGRTTVKIQAVNKGQRGNVVKGKITEWGAETYPVKLINSVPTTGGKNKVTKVVTEKDLAQGVKTAKTELSDLVQKRLSRRFSNQQIFFNQHLRLIKQKFIPQTKPGTIADQALIKAKLKAVGFGLQKEGLKDLVFKLYKERLDSQFKLRNSQITIKGIEITAADSNQVEFKVKSRGKVVGKIDKQQLIKQIIGKKVAAAKKLLNKIPTVESYTIKPVNQVNLPNFQLGLNLVVKETKVEE